MVILATAGCSRDDNASGGPAAEGPAKTAQDRRTASGHPLDGVWDFATSVSWTTTGTSYIRGTLYVKTENDISTCALTAFQTTEARQPFSTSLGEATTSTEQDCQLFVSEGEFSVKSTVRRGPDGYVADDFHLRSVGAGKGPADRLAGQLISNVTLDVTFVRRGSGLKLAQPWRMQDRDRADAAMAPFTFLAHGKTGCSFGISAIHPAQGGPVDGVLFDLRRLCRDTAEPLSQGLDEAELREGYFLACETKTTYRNWSTTFTEGGRPIRTRFANVEGGHTSLDGREVPRRTDDTDIARTRIRSEQMPAKGFEGEPVAPGSILSLVAERACG